MTTATESEKAWLIAEFEPVSLFSLRSTYATSKGGKTLLVPTPYAVKMALLNASFAIGGGSCAANARARTLFEKIKAAPVRVLPPAECIVQNTFVKALQQYRPEKNEIAPPPFRSTIVYREFAAFHGALVLAIGCADGDGMVTESLLRVNQLGKRGSFFQFLGCRAHLGPLPPGFSVTDLDEVPAALLNAYRTAQYLDDFGAPLLAAADGFERVSTYHKAPLTLGRHRVLQHTLLPYALYSAGAHHTHYRRTI